MKLKDAKLCSNMLSSAAVKISRPVKQGRKRFCNGAYRCDFFHLLSRERIVWIKIMTSFQAQLLRQNWYTLAAGNAIFPFWVDRKLFEASKQYEVQSQHALGMAKIMNELASNDVAFCSRRPRVAIAKHFPTSSKSYIKYLSLERVRQ